MRRLFSYLLLAIFFSYFAVSTVQAQTTTEIIVGTGTADTWAEAPDTFDSDDSLMVFGGPDVEHLLLFSGLEIAPGATISNASLELTYFGSGGNSVSVTIGAVDSPDVTAPSNYAEFVSRASDLVLTTVDWNSVPNQGFGETAVSPDLTALVQALVDHPDWDYNDSIMIWIGDNGSEVFSNRQFITGDYSGGEPKPTLVITYEEINLPPVAVDDSFETNAATTFNVLLNDSDPESGALTVTGVGTPAHGTAQVVDNQILYTPTADYVGSDTFTYTLSDPAANTDTGTVTVNVVENPIYYAIDFDIDDSGIPDIYWRTVTYQVTIGSSTLVNVYIDGVATSYTHNIATGIVYFAGSGDTARVLVKNPQNVGSFAVGKAPLKDGKKFAWSHSMDDNVYLDEQIALMTSFGWTGGVNIIAELVNDTRQEDWIADKPRILELLAMGWAIGNHGWYSNCAPPGDDWETDILDGYNRLKSIIAESSVPTYKLIGFAAPCFLADYDPFIVSHRTNTTTEVQFNQSGGNGLMIINSGAANYSAAGQSADAVDSDTVKIGRDLGIEVDPADSIAIIDWMNTNSTTTRNFWYNTLTHGNKEAALLQVAQHANDEYGADGTNVIWVASPEEIYSYLLARDNTVLSNTATTQLSTGEDPVLSEINATVTGTTVELTWTTSRAASSQVNYGLTSSLGTATAETDTAPRVTSHTVELSGLTACTEYHYQVVSTDAYEATAESSVRTVTTEGDCPTPTPTPTPTATPAASSQSSSSSVSQKITEAVCSFFKPAVAPTLFSIERKGSEATIYFVPVNNNADHYLLEYGKENLGEHAVEFTAASNGVQEFTVKSLEPQATYRFAIRAGNGCAPGEWSSTLTSHTNQLVSYAESNSADDGFGEELDESSDADDETLTERTSTNSKSTTNKKSDTTDTQTTADDETSADGEELSLLGKLMKFFKNLFSWGK